MDEADRVRRSVGLRIVELRRAQKVTQERLAERLSMDTRDLRRIEAGEVNVTIDTVTKIAQALATDVRDLFSVPPTAQTRRPGRPSKDG